MAELEEAVGAAEVMAARAEMVAKETLEAMPEPLRAAAETVEVDSPEMPAAVVEETAAEVAAAEVVAVKAECSARFYGLREVPRGSSIPYRCEPA